MDMDTIIGSILAGGCALAFVVSVVMLVAADLMQDDPDDPYDADVSRLDRWNGVG